MGTGTVEADSSLALSWRGAAAAERGGERDDATTTTTVDARSLLQRSTIKILAFG